MGDPARSSEAEPRLTDVYKSLQALESEWEAGGEAKYEVALNHILEGLPGDRAPIERAVVLALRKRGPPTTAATKTLTELNEALGLVSPALAVATAALLNRASTHLELPPGHPERDLQLAAASASTAGVLAGVVGDRAREAAAHLLISRIALAGGGTDGPTRRRYAIQSILAGLRLFEEGLPVDAAPLEFALLQKQYADQLLEIQDGSGDRAREAVQRLERAIAVDSPLVNAYQRIWLNGSLINACRVASWSSDRQPYLERARQAAAAANEAITDVERAGPAPQARAFVENALGVLDLELGQSDESRFTSAIEHFNRSMESSADDPDAMQYYNLGVAYRAVSQTPDDEAARSERDSLRRSITAAKLAGDVAQVELSSEALAASCSRANDLTAAGDAWREVLAAGSALLDEAVARESRRLELTRQIDRHQRAVSGVLRAGDIATAVAALEAHRGVLPVAPASDEEARLIGQDPVRLEQYRRARHEVARLEAADRRAAVTGRTIEPGYAVAVEELRLARRQLSAAIAAIRELPGFEHFLRLPNADELRARLPTDRSVTLLYSAISAESSALVAVQRDDLKVIDLPFTDTELSTQLSRYARSYSAAAERPYDVSAQDAWLATVDELGRWLWDRVLSTLLENLDTTELVVITGGWLALLPFHLAWRLDPVRPTGREYAGDRVSFSYAPNGRGLAFDTKPLSGTEPAFAVTDPRPTAAGPLLFARHEWALVSAAFSHTRKLVGMDAQLESVKKGIGEAAVVHIASHGFRNFDEPLLSGLRVACHKVLTLADLQDLQTPVAIRLAVLSACETALLDVFAPDEPLGLAATLREMGVDGVIGSVWQVPELPTFLLMSRLYWELGVGHKLPQPALQHAQVWVRDTTNGEKAEFFAAAEQSGWRLDPEVAAWLRDELAVLDSNARDFAHPVNWAGFQMVGS